MTDFYRALLSSQVQVTQLLTEHDSHLTPAERRTLRRVEEYLVAMTVKYGAERDGKGTPRRRALQD